MIRDLAALHRKKNPPTALWRSPELQRDAWQALLWLPALAIVYWWTLTGLQAWLKPADKLTAVHFWHGLALVLLAGLAFLIIRLAPERLATRRLWQTTGVALGGGLVVILALPLGSRVRHQNADFAFLAKPLPCESTTYAHSCRSSVVATA